MSLIIGNLINETLTDNRLKINTYNNSNVINLNIDGISYKDAIINYKNIGEIGVSNSSIIFNYSKQNIFNANLNNSIFYNDVVIKNIFYTSNNSLFLNSNLSLNLTNNPNNNFKIINSNNNTIFQTTNSNITINFNNSNKITIDNSQFKVNDNITINSNFSLITSNIKPINPNYPIVIDNAIFKNLAISSYNIKNSLNINNDTLYPNESIFINRYEIDCNIIDIYNKKIIDNSSNRIFSINKNGFVCIGSNTASCPIQINKNYNNSLLFNYNNNCNDNFIITDRGYIGIGASVTNNQFYVNINDDNRNIINNPVINLNFNYNRNSNFRTSNIIDLDFIANKTLVPIFNNEDTQIGSTEIKYDNFLYNIIDNFNIYNATEDTPATVEISIVNTVNNDYIVNNNITSIIDYNSFSYQSFTLINNDINYVINYILKFPRFLNINTTTSPFLLAQTDPALKEIVFTTYLLKDGNSLPLNPSQEFIDSLYRKDDVKKRVYISNPSVDTSFRIFIIHRFYIEKNVYQLKSFIDSINFVYQPPSLLFYATSNNNFSASLNSEGKLALGDKDITNNYYLYVNKKTRLNNLECDYLSSVSGKNNINYSGCNISNINKSFIQSNFSLNLISSYATINNCSNTNLISSSINVSSLNASNLIYNTISASNLFISSNLFNPNLKTIFGNSTFNDNYFMNFNFNSSNNGFAIQSAVNNIHPFISINGLVPNTNPYISFSNMNANYSFMISSNNKTFLTPDNFTFIDYKNNRTILKHLNYIDNQNNQLIIGNNNSIFDLFNTTEPNNTTNKIALGIPYRFLIQNNCNISEWNNYFKNNSLESDCMLNIYGNINLSTINNTPFIKCIATDFPNESVSINIAGASSRNGFVFNVNGNSYFSSNINVNNDIYVIGTIGNVSDIRVKENLNIIKNPIEKINKINGYIYKRRDTGKIETGLIAQEVIKILPEVINYNNTNYLNISYGNMAGLLVEGIKELNYKIKRLEFICSILIILNFLQLFL